ncbi:MAG: TonB-dependent receptor domain-containing protein, partial [Terriglobia bacterium]
SYYWFDLPTIIDNNVDPDVLSQILSDDSRTSAVYGSVQYDILPSLTVSVEARLQRDTVIGLNPLPPNPGQPPLPSSSVTTDSYLPRYSLSYKIHPNLSIYAQVAEGDDPAGNNPDVLTPIKVQLATLAGNLSQLHSFLHYKEEKLWNYELGAKGDFFDHHLTIDGDVYYLTWQNYQNSTNYQIAPAGTYPGVTTVPSLYASHVTFNEGTLHGKGLEVTADYLPVRILDLTLAYSHNEMTYVTACSPNITQFGFVNQPGFPYPCVNVDGKDLPLIPHDTVSLGVALTSHPFSGDFVWTNRAEAYYTGRQYMDDTNLNWIAPIYNVSLYSILSRGTISFTAFIKNLTDNRTPTGVGGPGSANVYLQSNYNLGGNAGRTGIDAAVAPPREYGLKMNYSF